MLTFYRDIKLSLLTLSILISGINIFAQNHVMHHYGVEDGLPSSEVYSAFQDSKGYMWFATDGGVSRFNGYEFENFDASDGLTDNTVFLITEDHRGRIWFGTFNLKLCYYENGRIYPYNHNDKIESKIEEKGAVCSFVVDSNDNVWMGFLSEGLYKVSKKGVIEQIIEAPIKTFYNFQFIESKGLSVFGTLINYSILDSTYSAAGDIKKCDISSEYKIIFTDGIYRDTLLQKKYTLGNYSAQMFKFKKDFGFLFNNELTLYQEAKNQITHKTISHNLSIDKVFSVMTDDYLWVCAPKKGVYQGVIQNDSLLVVNHYLKENNVSRVFKDNNGGYWFMTLNDGVYYLPLKEVSYIKTGGEEGVLSIAVDTLGKRFFLGLTDGSVSEYRYKNSHLRRKEIYEHSGNNFYSLLYNYSTESLLIGISDLIDYLPYYKNGKIAYMKSYGTGGYRSMMFDKGKFYGAGSYGITMFNYKNEEDKYSTYLKKEERIWCTDIVKYNEKLWVGSKEGVRILSKGKLHNPFIGNKYLSSAITSMALLTSETLLIGTKNFGILILTGDSIITRISDKDGLVSRFVKSLHIDSEGTIWAGTNKGLSRIDYHSKDDFTVKNISSNHGLISVEINAICSSRDTIYLGTPKGLIQFDKTKVKTNITPPPVFITQFNVNSEEREIEDNINLTYNENFIKIHFEGLNYRSLGEVEYQYRMLGVDTNWSNTTIRFVQYPTLQANDYQFEVKAKNEDGYWSEPKRLSFSISPPFWLTWWFIILEIILGVGIVSTIFWYREKEIRAKSVVSKKMVELELKALRSQMNPHFIFNTLNSIQHYIAVNDFRSTNKYIVQFANLIRTILNLSEKSVITIQEEIDILTMYMDLEKMRFEEQFDYKIEVSNEIDKDYDEIPSMLLQPYVENAIWHGLMSKKGKGLIKIEIRGEGEYICCSVEDNGIGRKAAAVIKAKRNIKQKSVGMSITKERLDLISDNDINVETIDLYNDNEEAVGTKMLIRIQYKT